MKALLGAVSILVLLAGQASAQHGMHKPPPRHAPPPSHGHGGYNQPNYGGIAAGIGGAIMLIDQLHRQQQMQEMQQQQPPPQRAQPQQQPKPKKQQAKKKPKERAIAPRKA